MSGLTISAEISRGCNCLVRNGYPRVSQHTELIMYFPNMFEETGELQIRIQKGCIIFALNEGN